MRYAPRGRQLHSRVRTYAREQRVRARVSHVVVETRVNARERA